MASPSPCQGRSACGSAANELQHNAYQRANRTRPASASTPRDDACWSSTSHDQLFGCDLTAPKGPFADKGHEEILLWGFAILTPRFCALRTLLLLSNEVQYQPRSSAPSLVALLIAASLNVTHLLP
ncbi:hypothetical protein OPT61_g5262 [Boeremia exigua]|uniref:Uncharacterized protein n=1 Tax=Boeremia exigua TaxID=749465 RepID=A0ACC2IAX7_9PLEO|nr:hypothetical protein OPT61_g5262 [Boeremia exigua]